VAVLGSIPEYRLPTRNAQKLAGRFRHHKPNGRKLPSLKKSAIQEATPLRTFILIGILGMSM
jgi:hypothetical protein